MARKGQKTKEKGGRTQEPRPHQGQPMARRAENPPNLPQVYANGFQIAVGPLDVRLYLIESFPVTATEVVDKRLLSVVMAPETLKLLADNLQKFVENYEAEFGKLRNLQTNLHVQEI
jgi:Protein of unknown function (DUF3467)